MSPSLQPLSDYVVAQAPAAETKTPSGLYVPDSVAQKPKSLQVVAIGKDVTQAKVGDFIVCRESFAITNIKFGSIEYSIVKEEDILAIVKLGKGAK